jgi:hypothetical protein
LAATIELDRLRRYDASGQPTSPGGLSDVLFLQQLYDAGAAPYFDVLAMQGYGLWSGPTDRRMQPRVLNFSRPLYVRDVMVRNGDAHKSIWLSELGWNAVPPESGIPPVYGQVTPEQQARYTALAYERLEREWPWLGVGFYWFFKQADERERASNPQYYFRMVEPDFTPMPVYQAVKEQTHQPPVVYQGWHQANHWAITYEGDWQPAKQPGAAFGEVIHSDQVGATATFTFEGSSLDLAALPSQGRLRVQIDQSPDIEIDLAGEAKIVNDQQSIVNSQSKIQSQRPPMGNRKSKIVNLAHSLPQRLHLVRLEILKGPVLLDGFVVESQPDLALNRAGSAVMVLATLGGLWLWWKQRNTKDAA